VVRWQGAAGAEAGVHAADGVEGQEGYLGLGRVKGGILGLGGSRGVKQSNTHLFKPAVKCGRPAATQRGSEADVRSTGGL
jgi:hypothetical protein